MRIPEGIGHIGEEQYENELKALVSGVMMTCEQCNKEYALQGGMAALIASFDTMSAADAYLCPDCKRTPEGDK